MKEEQESFGQEALAEINMSRMDLEPKLKKAAALACGRGWNIHAESLSKAYSGSIGAGRGGVRGAMRNAVKNYGILGQSDESDDVANELETMVAEFRFHVLQKRKHFGAEPVCIQFRDVATRVLHLLEEYDEWCSGDAQLHDDVRRYDKLDAVLDMLYIASPVCHAGMFYADEAAVRLHASPDPRVFLGSILVVGHALLEGMRNNRLDPSENIRLARMCMTTLQHSLIRRAREITDDWADAFVEVHKANMKKALGTNKKRPWMQADAVKPEGWEPPDLKPFLSKGTVAFRKASYKGSGQVNPEPVRKDKMVVSQPGGRGDTLLTATKTTYADGSVSETKTERNPEWQPPLPLSGFKEVSASAKTLKDDDGKVMFDSMPPHAVERIAEVFHYGAKKYGSHNWRAGLGLPHSRYYSAAMRHLLAFWTGKHLSTDPVDPESNLHHLAHAAANIMIMLDNSWYKAASAVDDRPEVQDKDYNEWADAGTVK